MSRASEILVIVLIYVLAAEACYAAPGFYTGWCDSGGEIFGNRNSYVTYCFKVYGSMSMNCDVMASNYPDRGPGRWGAYNIGVVNNNGCYNMYWGPVAGAPSVRCWSYGLATTFSFSAG